MARGLITKLQSFLLTRSVITPGLKQTQRNLLPEDFHRYHTVWDRSRLERRKEDYPCQPTNPACP